MTTGDKIIYFRNFRGISQKKLAELSGVSEGAIRKYEAGTRNPKQVQLSAIAGALGIDEFVFYDFVIDTPARAMSLLYLLDDSFDMQFDGERDTKGNLIPQTITIHFDNEDLNKRLTTWAVMKAAYKNVKRENYESDELYDVVRLSLLEKYEKCKLRLADSNRITAAHDIEKP